MALQRHDYLKAADVPEIGKAETSYPSPNIADRVVIERVPIKSGKYRPLPYHSPHPDYDRNGLILVWQGKVKAENNQLVATRIYSNNLGNEDWYNATYHFSGDYNVTPIWVRTYIELRRDYVPLDKASRLSRLIRLKLISGGTGYTSVPTVVFSAGSAAARAIMNPDGTKVIGFELTNPGHYTTVPGVTITGGTPSVTAVATAELQPLNTYLVKEDATKLDSEDPHMASLFVKVTRVYETLPGPWLPYTRYDFDLGPVRAKRRAVLTDPEQRSVQTAFGALRYESREGSAIVSWEIVESWTNGTGDDLDSLPFPIRDEDVYDRNQRGRVHRSTQVVVKDGSEQGSFVRGVLPHFSNTFLGEVVGAIKTDYEAFPENELLLKKVVEEWIEPNTTDQETTEEYGGGILDRTKRTDEPGVLEVEQGAFVVDSKLETTSPHEQTRITRKLANTHSPYLRLTNPGHDYVTAPVVVFGAGNSGSGAAGTANLSAEPVLPPEGEPGGVFQLDATEFGDDDGVFHFLGARYNDGTWRNPAPNIIEITSVSQDPQRDETYLAHLTDRDSTFRVVILPVFDSGSHYILFDLGVGRRLKANRIFMRQSTPAQGPANQQQHRLRVEGIEDDLVTAHSIGTDIPIPQGSGEWGAGTLDDTDSFRYFRIYGLDDSIPDTIPTIFPPLVLSEVEFYGELTITGGIQKTYNFDGDANGVLYEMGVRAGDGTWINPHTAGAIEIDTDDLVTGTEAEVVDRQSSNIIQGGGTGDSYYVDLITGSLVCDKVSFRQRNAASTACNVVLQGTNTLGIALDWTNMVGFVTPATAGTWKTVSVPGSTSYRRLRVISAQANFAIGELELYGALTFPAAPADPTYRVDSITVTNGGSGYVDPPAVIIGSVVSGGGTGAAGTAVLTDGVVTSVLMTNRGSGYLTAPDVIFAGSTGAGATAQAFINGTITDIDVTDDGGMTYPSAPLVSLVGDGVDGAAHAVVGKAIASIAVDDPSDGYNGAPGISFSGGAGSGADAHAVLSYPLDSIDVDTNGSGFSSPPTVNIDPPTGVGGIQATAHAVMGTGGGPITDSLPFGSVGDNSGAFNWIGRNFSGGSWAHPVLNGLAVNANQIIQVGDRENAVNQVSDENFFPNVANDYIEFDLGVGRQLQLTDWTYQSRDVGGGSPASDPTEMTLEGSNNGTTWTPIAVESGLTFSVSAEWKHFTVAMTPAYRYFRITQTAINSSGGNHFCFSEFELYGDFLRATGGVTTDAVETVVIDDPGYGYLVEPGVSFTGDGSGAAASANLETNNGSINNIVVDDPGQDYESTPGVVFASGAAAATATRTTNGRIKAVVVDDGGSDYSFPPVVNFASGTAEAEANIEGPIDHINVLTAGSGYDTAPDVVLGGAGGGVAHAVVGGGIVTSIIVDLGGSYDNSPGVSLQSAGEPIAQAFLGFRVDDVNVTNGGNNYVNPPAVDFIGECTDPAQGYAILGYSIDRVIMRGRGSNYTSTPSVVFTGGNPSTAATGTAQRRFPLLSVTVTNGGSSYETPPLIHPVGGSLHPDGQAAQVIAIVGRPIDEIILHNPGEGYTSEPDVDFSAPLANETGGSADSVLGFTLVEIPILTGGTLYATPPAVVITGGDPTTPAVAHAVVNAGVVTAIVIDNPGVDYESVPTVTLDDTGTGGSGATLDTAELSVTGRVKRVEITAAGVYGTPPTLSFSGGGTPTIDAQASAALDVTASGPVVRVDVVNPGNGYQTAPSLSVSNPGGGSGLAVTFVLSTLGQIFGVTITNAGAGYTGQPTVTFSTGLAYGDAVRSAVGKVKSITLTRKGAGYADPPDINFVGGGGTGAVADADLENTGSIRLLLLIFPGPHYSVAPIVSFVGGGGADAAALYILGTGWPMLNDIVTDAVEAFRVLVTRQVLPVEGYTIPDEVYLDLKQLDVWRFAQIVSKLDLHHIPPTEEFEQSYHLALPDTLLAVTPFYSRETEDNTRFQYEYVHSDVTAKVVGHIAVATRRGFNGAVIAKAVRRFFVGPPPIGSIPPPTHILPSKGTVTLTSQVRGYSKEYGRHGANSRAFVSQRLHNYDAIEIGEIGNVLTGGLINNYSSGELIVPGTNITQFAVWLENNLSSSFSFSLVRPLIVPIDLPTVRAIANLSFALPPSCPAELLPGATLLVAVNVSKLRFNLFEQTTIYATIPSGCVEPEPPSCET